MSTALIDTLREWRDFFSVIGTAAATLVGAMFIVASVGSGLFRRQRERADGGMRAFVTATAIHVSAVLLGSALMMVPTLTWNSLAAILGAGGLAGLLYSGVIATQVLKRKLDIDDRLWYGALPPLAYALVCAVAALLYWRSDLCLDLLAVSFVLLLVIGLRNAWDMTIFIVKGEWDSQ